MTTAEKPAQQLVKLPLLAPVSGEALPISQHYEPAISHGLQGQGVMLKPLGSRLVAPCDGVISEIAATNHQLKMQASHGVIVEITCGYQALETHGCGFVRKVNVGQRVKCGDVLLELDLINIRKQIPHLDIALLLTNGVLTVKPHYGNVRANEETVLTGVIKPK
ncbi:MAG: PTS sugar transporter subunit IIA [Psychrobium sp.]